MAAFLAGDEKVRFSGSPVPDKSEKAKTPTEAAPDPLGDPSDGGIRLFRDIRDQSPGKTQFCEADDDGAENAAKRAAVASEPELPPTGTPERARLDRDHATMLAGLTMAAAKRPPAWGDPAALPSPGCRCSCCGGSRWWCEAVAAKGWRCATCRPPDHLAAEAVRWVAS
jgi:hypothetical protein